MAWQDIAKNPTVQRWAGGLVISIAGLVALQGHEGERYAVYLDIAGVPTDCMGNTRGLTRADVGTVRTKEYCDRVDRANVVIAQDAVRAYVTVPISQNQFDALVDFTFNLGIGALRTSTLLSRLNDGDCFGAAAEFTKWDKARVQGVLRPVQGLTFRRADNRKTFEADCK